MRTITTALLVLGGFICIINFYLSYLRYLLYKLRGGKKDNFKWISGFPIIGSLLVALAMTGFKDTKWMIWTASALILIDTGGIHWFAGTMAYRHFTKKG